MFYAAAVRYCEIRNIGGINVEELIKADKNNIFISQLSKVNLDSRRSNANTPRNFGGNDEGSNAG